MTLTATPAATPGATFDTLRRALPIDAAPAVTADLNGDGTPDLALGGSTQARLLLLFGSPSGLNEPIQIRVDAATGGFADLAIGRLTSVGGPDVIASDPAGQRVVTLLGDGHGEIGDSASTSLAATPGRLLVHSLLADPAPDLIVAVEDAVLVLPGLRDGTFDDGLTIRLPTSTRPVDLLLFDADRDGRQDILAAAGDEVLIFVNAGDGGFTAAPPLTAGLPTALAAGDFNSDGRLDLAVADSEAGEILLFQGTERGISRVPIVAAQASNVLRLVRTDINADGIADLVALDSTAGVARVLLGDGHGHFDHATDVAAGSESGGLGAADFDGDRLPDLALTATGDGALVLATNASPVTVLPGDVDQDDVVGPADTAVLGAEIFDGDLPDADSCAAGVVVSNANADANGDGVITAADLPAIAARTGSR